MTAVTPSFISEFGALSAYESSKSIEEIVASDEADKIAILNAGKDFYPQSVLLHRTISKIVSLSEPRDLTSLWAYTKRLIELDRRLVAINIFVPHIRFNLPRLYSEVVLGKTTLNEFTFPIVITGQFYDQTTCIKCLLQDNVIGEMFINRVYFDQNPLDLKPEQLFEGLSSQYSSLRVKIVSTLPIATKPIAKLLIQIIKEIFNRESDLRIEILTGMWESDVFFAERFKLIYAKDFEQLARRYNHAQCEGQAFAGGPGPDNIFFYKSIKEQVANPILTGTGLVLNPYFYRNLRTP